MIAELALLLFLPFLFGLGALFFARKVEKSVGFILAFSGAYLFGITIAHLLPEVYSMHLHLIPVWVLGGFVLQLFLDFLSRGVEHGHIHAGERLNSRLVFSIMAGLSIHALLEGIPLGSRPGHLMSLEAHAFHTSLLASIALHKMPAAFALMMILHSCGLPVRKAVWFLLFFAAMSPLSYLLTHLALDQQLFSKETITPVLALVAGSFMHISTTIIFESDPSGHQLRYRRLFAILAGLFFAILPLFF